MIKGPIHHPIQQAIEDIWKAGHTPRIQLDARRADVEVPQSVREKWGARLVLDLDAAWPLNLEYDSDGIAVDLAFQGHVSRCKLPWVSIYVVLDRATGRGVVIEPHLPEDEASARVEAPKPERVKRAPPAGAGALKPERVKGAPLAGAEASKSAKSAPPSSEETSSEEEARRRRARFKVIDGGR